MTARLASALLALGSSAFAAAEPPPLLLWDFNEGGGACAASRGVAGDADLYLLAPGGAPAKAFSVDGKGVSEKPGDYAFDLTTATGMGATKPNSTGPSGVAWSNSPALAALSGLSSFTITGWVKPTATINSSARIVNSGTITLMAGVENRLVLQINASAAAEQSMPAYGELGSWIFFAVTYDGTRSTQNVAYYAGSVEPGSLVPAGLVSLAGGPLKPFTGQLVVGNNSNTAAITRPFMGLIDHLAIYGAKEGPGGALSQEAIEAVRASALR